MTLDKTTHALSSSARCPPRCSRWLHGVLVVFLITSRAAVAAQPSIAPADLVFRGSAILTLDAATARAEAVAVREGRIVFVGNARGAAPYIGDHTQVIDLGKRMLMPAFHDAHMHPMSGGMRLLRCALDDSKTAQGAVDALAACARRWPSSPWLIANGLSDALARDALLDRHALDRIVPDRPLAVSIGSGFTLRANSRALALAGLDRPSTDAPGKDIDRDGATGEATGLLSGDAVMAIRRLWPRPTSDEYRQALREATTMANRFGIVSIFDASVDRKLLDAYRAADDAGELTVHVVAAQLIEPEEGIAQIEAMRQARDAIHSERLRADAAKIFVDGEIELHTAALLQSYLDVPGERGKLFVDTDQLDEFVTRLDRAGFDVHFHAIGDRAVRSALDAIEHAIKDNGVRDRRDQVAHNQLVDPADFPRFAALGVVANVQPEWAWHDAVNEDAEQKLGLKRARFLVPIRSLVDAGARVAAGNDWPATTMNPLDAIQIAVTRRPLDGSAPAWHPQQRVTLMQMLRAYCTDAAWALRQDKISGSITLGKSADLIVLDRDLRLVNPMELHTVPVMLTLLEGKAVYRDPAFDEAAKQ